MQRDSIGNWVSRIRLLEKAVQNIKGSDPNGAISLAAMEHFDLNVIVAQLRNEGLHGSADRFARTVANWREGYTSAELMIDIQEILNCMESDTNRMACLLLSADQASWYDFPPDQYFGEQVCNSFPSYVFDMQEALFCYSLERSTACVFHCMRILESASKVIVDSLPSYKFKSDGVPGWGLNRRMLDEYLSIPKKDWTDEFKLRESFYNEIRADFTACYKSWRCESVHGIEKVYTIPQAKNIMDTTKALMIDIAAHLDENGKFKACP